MPSSSRVARHALQLPPHLLRQRRRPSARAIHQHMHRAETRPHVSPCPRDLHRECHRRRAALFHMRPCRERFARAHRRKKVRLHPPHRHHKVRVCKPSIPPGFPFPQQILHHPVRQLDRPRIKNNSRRISISKADGQGRLKCAHTHFIAPQSVARTDNSLILRHLVSKGASAPCVAFLPMSTHACAA